MALVDRACYCTREQVRRALDVKQAQYNIDQVDRAILSASEAVDALTQRKFFPEDAVKRFDWPNFQYAYPWELWLDHNELAAIPTLVTTGSLLPVPIVIPVSAVICQPVNNGPPFTHIELRRDLNYAFGYNSTPQLDIAITGTFGYWMKTRSSGTATAPIGSGDVTVQISDSSLIGVGDVLIADLERMIVTDMEYADTGISYSGLSTASAADNQIQIASGTFKAGEVILVDAEWLLVQAVYGSTLIVKRAWDASVLSAHAGGTLYSRRSASVLRGQLGTMSAAHAGGVALSVSAVPGLIRQLAVGEAINWLTLEPGAYSQATGGLGSMSGLGVTMGSSGRGTIKEGVPGIGLATLRDQVINSKYARKARSRAI